MFNLDLDNPEVHLGVFFYTSSVRTHSKTIALMSALAFCQVWHSFLNMHNKFSNQKDGSGQLEP